MEKYKKITLYNTIMDPTNMVLYQKGEDIYSSGFKVESPILNSGSPLMTSSHQLGGGSTSINDSPFALPIGLLFKPPVALEKTQEGYENAKVIGNDIYDKLLELMQLDNKSKSRTKRMRTRTTTKTTRRSKST